MKSPWGDAPAASDTLVSPKVDRGLRETVSTVDARKLTKQLTTATDVVDADTETKQQAAGALQDAQDAVDTALRDVGNTVVTKDAHAVRAAAPNVDPALLAGFEAAVSALQVSIDDADPLVAPINAYVAAAKTVLDAQTAFNTQAAIDAANAAGDDTYVDPSTGESKPNPNYDGSGSGSGDGSGSGSGGGSGSGDGGGSGGGSGGGGGSGDGGGSGGGGSAAPTPPRIVYGSSSCSGAGGYAESSYNNRTIGVPGSGVASINGPYDSGSGWRVDWTCV